MDCNQRIAFLLLSALALCASDCNVLSAQDGRFSASPGVNTPKALSNEAWVAEANAAPGNVQVPTENHLRTPLKRSTGASDFSDNGTTDARTGSSSAGMVLTALIVLLIFVLGVARLFLKRSPYSLSGLPTDAVDILGRRSIDPRNSVYMIKVGSRLVLLGSSPNGLSNLTEITDPIEVASLANVCHAAKQTGPDAARWLSKLWQGSTTVVESRPFDDQLGEKLFEEAQRSESGRVDSFTIARSREQHRAG